MQVKLQIGFISLGCSKNQVDTEIMMGLLKKAGHSLVSRTEEAELLIINTCGFLTSAQEEAIQEILQAGECKQYGQLRRIIAAGCLSQRFGEELLEEMPELDGVVGISEYLHIVEIVERVWQGERVCMVQPPAREYIEKGPRILTTPPGYAYLKVAEGCNNRCSYCAIPNIRGRLRSRPLPELVEEARELAKRGCRELILIAQDTAAYGKDLKDGTTLAGLLRALEPIEGIEWLRLLYLHPHSIDRALLDEMKRNRKVLPYLDMPIQHINQRILKQMHRPETTAYIQELTETLRREIPRITLRTTMMVGFPGETDEEFEELLAFTRKAEFEWMGSFVFEPQDGTAAASLPEQVAEETAAARQERLMAAQRRITRRANKAHIGQTERVLLTGKLENQLYVGHTASQTPEVDGVTLVQSPQKLTLGTMVPVLMKAVRDYDMIGELSHEYSE